MLRRIFNFVDSMVQRKQNKIVKNLSSIEQSIAYLQDMHREYNDEYVITTRIAGKISEILYIQGEHKK